MAERAGDAQAAARGGSRGAPEGVLGGGGEEPGLPRDAGLRHPRAQEPAGLDRLRHRLAAGGHPGAAQRGPAGGAALVGVLRRLPPRHDRQLPQPEPARGGRAASCELRGRAAAAGHRGAARRAALRARRRARDAARLRRGRGPGRAVRQGARGLRLREPGLERDQVRRRRAADPRPRGEDARTTPSPAASGTTARASRRGTASGSSGSSRACAGTGATPGRGRASGSSSRARSWSGTGGASGRSRTRATGPRFSFTLPAAAGARAGALAPPPAEPRSPGPAAARGRRARARDSIVASISAGFTGFSTNASTGQEGGAHPLGEVELGLGGHAGQHDDGDRARSGRSARRGRPAARSRRGSRRRSPP